MSYPREFTFVPESSRSEDFVDIQPNISWNPEKLGPLSCCIKCFKLMNGTKAFCSRCGHISTIFNAPDNCKTKLKYCSNHKGRLAVGWCDLHAKPICENCDSQGIKLEDYYDYTVNLNCKNCLAEANVLKNAFLKDLEKTGSCCKHSTNRAIFSCISCDLPLCKNCAYNLSYSVTIKKNVFQKVTNDFAEGSYCLGCLRTSTHWIDRDSTSTWSHVAQ
jgi:hypothetical protein